jgi:hypothetical protein
MGGVSTLWAYLKIGLKSRRNQQKAIKGGVAWEHLSNKIFGVARFDFRVAGQEREQRKRATRNPQPVTSEIEKWLIPR